MNIAQAAQLAVEQVLAFPGAEKPAGNHDLALLRGTLKLATANLEHDCLRATASCLVLRLVGAFFVEYLSRLFVGDDLLGLCGSLAAHLVLIPVGGAVLLDDHLRLNRHWPFIGLGIDHGQRHFGHAEGLAVARSGKDDVLHIRAAQALGALLAQYPTNPVQNV